MAYGISCVSLLNSYYFIFLQLFNALKIIKRSLRNLRTIMENNDPKKTINNNN